MELEHQRPRDRIRRLDSLTIDKIAAGEVIDAPAACIKELVDNAIDAKASHITVEISVGGREWLKVTDDGQGMSAEDVKLSIERHATSKLAAIEDLECLISMGFRGEALSSIASVSKLKITSCEKPPHHGGDTESSGIGKGAQIVVHGGSCIDFHTDVPAPYGTSVEVASLFYNIPARRKFLKSPNKDAQDIQKAITQIALATPHVAFRYIADGVVKLSYGAPRDMSPSSLFRQRVEDVLGPEVSSNGLFFEHKEDPLVQVRGFLAFPELSRTTRSLQYTIVNGRPVQSLMISYAVKSGYATSIGREQHPLYVLQIDINPSDIDVNVHPQKKEIRFRNEEYIRSLIEQVTAGTLFGRISFPQPQRECNNPEGDPNTGFSGKREGDGKEWDIGRDSVLCSIEGGFPKIDSSPCHRPEFFGAPSTTSTPSIWEKSPWEKASSSLTAPSSETIDMAFEAKAAEACSRAGSAAEGELSSSYIHYIPRSTYAIAMIPSAKESTRVPYLVHIEHAMKAVYILRTMASSKKESIAEPLLVPHLLRLTKDQSEYLESILTEVEDAGFSLRPFGVYTYLIEAAPRGTLLAKLDIDMFFQMLATTFGPLDTEGLSEQEENASQRKEALQACRKASLLMRTLRAFTHGQDISYELVVHIVREWYALGAPSVSLSGDRVSIPLDKGLADMIFSRSSLS